MADAEKPAKKMKYPKSVFFIISNEFCERFSYYGMRTILSFYFADILLYSEDTATVMYHAFTSFAYFFPLLGAILADSWLGKFRTIFYLSIVYVLGQLLLSISSVPMLNLPVREFSILGLLLIALGTGGIKPCVAAFGGDQFTLPQQAALLSGFFSIFYMSINSGSLVSTFLTPILRKDIPCFGKNTCYPLAFLIPAILMAVSVVIFVAGKRLYKIREPEGNVFINVVKCISHGISRKISSSDKREHWLDHADDVYDRRTIEDIKATLKVLKLFIPLPVFWALFDQQASRWTFQASRMDGEVFGYVMKPDQLQVINPAFVIVLIPIFQFFLYPVLEKFFFISTPLRKLTLGGFLAGLAFIISGIVELNLESTYAVQPSSGLAQVRIFNTLDCNASITLGDQKIALEALNMYENISIPAQGIVPLKFNAEFSNCPYINTASFNATLEVQEHKSMSWVMTRSGLRKGFEDKLEKAKSGDPSVRAMIYLGEDSPDSVVLGLQRDGKEYEMNVTKKLGYTDFIDVTQNVYELKFNGKLVGTPKKLRNGGVYTIVGDISGTNARLNTVTVIEPNSIHMLWLLPQYIVMTMGEIMFSVTGLEFAFTQSPVSMKSLLQSCWLMTVAVGNLIVVVIAEAHFFDRQVFEFFLFAVLMVADMLIFALMAKFYKYVDNSSNEVPDTPVDITLKPTNGSVNDSYSDHF